MTAPSPRTAAPTVAPLLCAVVLGCTSHRPAVATRPPAPLPTTTFAAGDLDAALSALAARVVGASEPREVTRSLGLTLARAEGRRGIDGAVVGDETVERAEVITRVEASAAVLVRTSCGNAWVVGLASAEGRWVPRASARLVPEARPGRCQEVEVRARATSLVTRDAREILAEFRSVSDDGADAAGPYLRLVHLDVDGGVTAWSDDLDFGGSDDATGAERRGEWFVEESFPPPRDLLVFVRPSHPGLDGRMARTMELRTYRVEGSRLRLVEQRTEPLRARPAR